MKLSLENCGLSAFFLIRRPYGQVVVVVVGARQLEPLLLERSLAKCLGLWSRNWSHLTKVLHLSRLTPLEGSPPGEFQVVYGRQLKPAALDGHPHALL